MNIYNYAMFNKYDEVIVRVQEILKEALCECITEDGVKVYTRYAIPGEIVKVKIFSTRPYYYGDVVEVISPSSLRVQPACKYFGQCGGCDLQMLPYQEQLKVKKHILLKEFQKEIDGFDLSVIGDVVPSPKELNYRNSVMFRVDPKRRRRIGFLKRDTNILIDIDECKISSELINYALKKVREQKNFPPHVFKVRSTTTGDLVVNQIETEEFEDRDVIEKVRVDDIEFYFKISRESFFQVNSYMIPVWLSHIREEIKRSDCDKSLGLDLYAGVGLISFFVSDLFDKVIGVEISRTSVRNARENIEMNNIKNVEVLEGDVAKYIDSMPVGDIVIIDPSRNGIEERVISSIGERHSREGKPRKIIYSSCNYETMIRDLKLFISLGYEVEKVTPFDMFPQTHHLELVAVLSD